MQSGLHYQDTNAQAADDAIAARKIGRQRRVAKRKFRHQSTIVENSGGQQRIGARIYLVYAGANYADCDSTAINCSLVRCSIDACGQPAAYSKSLLDDLSCKQFGGFATINTAATTADDRNLRNGQCACIAAHKQEGRRVCDLSQQRRISRVCERDDGVVRQLRPCKRRLSEPPRFSRLQ